MCFARDVRHDDMTLHDTYVVALATSRYSMGEFLRCQCGFDASALEDSVMLVADEKSEQTFELGLYCTLVSCQALASFP